MKYLNKEAVKHFNRLCESIVCRYDIADRDQLRSILQSELSVTLDRVLGNQEKFSSANQEGVAVISSPINSLEDVYRNSINGEVKVYLKADYYIDTPDVVMGDGGEEFLNTRSTPEHTNVFLGTLTVVKNKNCKFVISEDFPADLIDLELYSKCWNTDDPRLITNFLNDIYNRFYKKGCHTTNNLLTGKTNNIIDHVTYGKLLAYAKTLYPLTFGKESLILKNVLQDMLGVPVEDVVICRPDNRVNFSIFVDDSDRDLVKKINTALEQFV